MENFITITIPEEVEDDSKIVESISSIIPVVLLESDEIIYESGKNDLDENIINIPVSRVFNIVESDRLAEEIVHIISEQGYGNFEVDIPSDEDLDEETYDGDDFFEAYGYLGFVEEDSLWEAEYQGRKVTLNKPMRGDVKKFKVYVRDPKTKNVKKVNFGDPNMRIKKSNPARRKSFRARHRCDNPGPKTKARYWSCKKW